MAQLEGTRDRSRQLADEEQRLSLELEEFRAEQARIAEEVANTGSQLAALEEAFHGAERIYQHTRGDLDATRTAATEAHKLLAQRAARLDAVTGGKLRAQVRRGWINQVPTANCDADNQRDDGEHRNKADARAEAAARGATALR